MTLIQLLLKISRTLLLCSALSGFVSGMSSVGLIALSNHILTLPLATKTTFVLPFIALCLLILLSYFTTQTLLVHLSQGAIYNLRLHLSQQILKAPLRQLESIGASRLLTTLTDDIQAVANAFEVVPILCVDVAIVLGCLAYLVWLSWPCFVGMVLLLGFGLISYRLPLQRAGLSLDTAHQHQDQLFKHFSGLIQGIKELKLSPQRRDTFVEQQLKSTAIATQRHHIKGMTFFAMAASWGHFYVFGTIGIFLFLLPHLLAIKAFIISGYVLTTIYLMAPLADIMTTLPTLTNANIALKRIDTLGLSLHQSEPSAAHLPPYTASTSWKNLTLQGITHTYYREREDHHFSLGPIDFTLAPGELVFLVGGNGSGKSTFAKILTGLYPPEQGSILLDGEPVTFNHQDWYRQHFSAIFSDFFLFEQLLDSQAQDAEVWEQQAQHYLVQLQLDHKVRIEQGQLSTTALSQGQLKRLALLAAYLENRPIYVFDEWASDQDPLFKHIFYTQILPALKQQGKAVLVITHDEQYFHHADRLFKLDYGKLEQSQGHALKFHSGSHRHYL
jgi:putative pyoverdin transport system ATP-binding/permease protein